MGRRALGLIHTERECSASGGNFSARHFLTFAVFSPWKVCARLRDIGTFARRFVFAGRLEIEFARVFVFCAAGSNFPNLNISEDSVACTNV